MNARPSTGSEGRKAVRRPSLPRNRSCLRCPLRTPSGKCLSPGLKSGRCGDWVWYMRGSKQCRHLYVKPKDPRTPRQRLWRARFAAASKKYSHFMTDDQREACIAAGAKLHSRPRLGQSGPLTGPQYSIRMDFAAKPWEGERPREPKTKRSIRTAQEAQFGLQTKGNSLSTSDPRRGNTGVPPGQRRGDTRRPTKREGARKHKVGGRWKVTGRSETTAAAQAYAIWRAALPEYSPCGAVAGSLPLRRIPRLRQRGRPHDPKPLTIARLGRRGSVLCACC